MMARLNPAGTSALTLVRMIISRQAAGSWSSTSCLDHVVEYLVEVIEHVGGAGGPRQRPSRKIDTECPALGSETHGLDRRRVREHSGSDEELPHLVLVQRAAPPDRLGELTGSPQSSKIERRRTRARDHHPQCRRLRQQAAELASE